MSSDRWLKVVASGSREDLIAGIGEAIQPLTKKVMNAPGPDIAAKMSTDMLNWVKDSSLLWAKNKYLLQAGIQGDEIKLEEGPDIVLDGAAKEEIERLRAQITILTLEKRALKKENLEQQAQIVALYDELGDGTKAN